MRRLRTALVIVPVICGLVALAVSSTGSPSAASAAPPPPTGHDELRDERRPLKRHGARNGQSERN